MRVPLLVFSPPPRLCLSRLCIASYQNRHFHLFSIYSTYIHIHVRQVSFCLHSTRRIHAMRLIRLHSSATTSTSNCITATYLGHAAKRC